MIERIHTTLVLATLASVVAGCSRSPASPEFAYPDLAGIYQGSVQYGCGIAGLPYGEEMPLSLQIRQDQGRLQGTWTEVAGDLVVERPFSGSIDVGAIRIVFQDRPDMRVHCYFDTVSQNRAELGGEGYQEGGADGQCLRFLVRSPSVIGGSATGDRAQR